MATEKCIQIWSLIVVNLENDHCTHCVNMLTFSMLAYGQLCLAC